jgi:branched-subunit amino acid aminotransferase/4-amino-4-deoxychorismate lyase
MSVHSAPVLKPDQPARWRLHVASCRLPANEVLAQFKTANKLPQILARAEAEAAGADEALLLNTDGHVVEGAASNLFWIERARVCTPPLASGVLAGVTRAVVAELCRQLRVPFGEATIELEALFRAQAVFLSLSSYGIVEAESINGRLVGGSPITKLLQSAYQGLLEDFAACAG